MSWQSLDENCPDQWDLVKVTVKCVVYGDPGEEFEREVTLHRGEERDRDAVRNQLPEFIDDFSFQD